ncbi:Aspartate/methionine/tyrosine aminotransferase [Cribrihabitans marinus]|uniref:Aspartate/methionine/tyrosine aminotransferase n=1 Tax=Cribrihabitans marinus TaxID=1227549 RepID=A0A1H6XZW6_9RHOB|nr:aminotransferase class I/II-fold pyridoxal phosphate-dependent enzyme [Cribrihabitans marinus]GGH27681.1 aspartate aminotransferase [Cribrihabitans marinus]SEJ30095.1 Aspartate/methionine/tyrosine aminotransferase [Cribrihabitans marinus]
MNFPERFSNLPDYTFSRLRALLDPLEPGGEVVDMSIGEPKHDFPPWVADVIAANAAGFRGYPPNNGTPELLGAVTAWIGRRHGVDMDPDRNVMALNGTREGLYNAAMALCPETKGGGRPVVLCPNPFYQVYMVAGLSVGAEPYFVSATAETGHLPDYSALPADILNRTALAYVCSPANPQGAVASDDYWTRLIGLAERHDFRILADECYSEIYRDTAPTGVLSAARDMDADPERVLLFNSLSKRSNLAGLRSGFVAGGVDAIRRIKQLRAYSGAPLPGPLQAAAARAWTDEAHVAENRALYHEKYRLADEILGGLRGYTPPEAGFFLWLPVDDGEAAAAKLWRETGVRVLPGAYLAQGPAGQNPGERYIRVAMVAPKTELRRGLTMIRDCVYE